MSDSDDRHPQVGPDGKMKPPDPSVPRLEMAALGLFGGGRGMTPAKLLTVVGRIVIAQIVLLALIVVIFALR